MSFETTVEYLRDDLFDTSGKQASKTLGNDRQIDGLPVSREIDEWLFDYDNEKSVSDANGAQLSPDPLIMNAVEFSGEILTMKLLAGVIWDKGLLWLAEYFDRETFTTNYLKIISALSNAGTLESIVKMLEIAIPNVGIHIDTNATDSAIPKGTALLSLDVPTADQYVTVTTNGHTSDENLTVNQTAGGSDDKLLVAKQVANLPPYQIVNLIKRLEVRGQTIEVKFN